MKHLRHKIQISIADQKGGRERVVSSTKLRLPIRILRLIFGEFTDVLVIAPGKSVEGIEIKEIGGDDSYSAAAKRNRKPD